MKRRSTNDTKRAERLVAEKRIRVSMAQKTAMTLTMKMTRM
jgi:hypothetical protein